MTFKQNYRVKYYSMATHAWELTGLMTKRHAEVVKKLLERENYNVAICYDDDGDRFIDDEYDDEYDVINHDDLLYRM